MTRIENTSAQNAFDSISVKGLVFRKVEGAHKQFPVTLSRRSFPVDLVDVFPHPAIEPYISTRPRSSYSPKGPQDRRPSKRPPPDDSNLSFSLGRVLGSGRSGIVYDVEHTRVLTGSVADAQPAGYLPPLVAKIGRQNRCQSIARDAWFYDEMEHLQGSSIARCYGCYELKLETGWHVNPWVDFQYDLYGSEPDTVPEYAMYPKEAAREAEILPHPLLRELIWTNDRVFILLLERLGSELSGGYNYSKVIQDDIKGLYKDVATMGITLASDIRPNNILAAPSCPPGLPTLPSPFTKHVHAWRLVDFELARKTAWKRRVISVDHNSWLDNMFDVLPLFQPNPNFVPPDVESSPSTP